MTRLALPRKEKTRIAIGVPLLPGALEQDLSDLVRLHLAALPWCRFWINKERWIERPDGRGSVYVPGLAEGSADLIGVVQRFGEVWPMPGIFTAIELKQPFSSKKPKAEQSAWLSIVTTMGGVAGWANSLFGALDFVADARGVSRSDVVDEIEGVAGRAVVP